MSSHSLAFALFVILTSACGGNSRAKPTAGTNDLEATVAVPDPALPSNFRGQTPALANAAVLHFLPDTTMAAVVLKSPLSVASALESTAIFRDYKDDYTAASKAQRLPNGANLWEVETWGQLGIDINQAAGAAFWVEERGVGAFFVSLSNPTLFLEQMGQLAQQLGLPDHSVTQVGTSSVMRFGKSGSVAVVTRDKVGMLVLSKRKADLAKALDTLTGQSNQPSLASSERVATSFANFDYGEDLAGFYAFDTIAERLLVDQREYENNDWYSSEIEKLELTIQTAKSEQKPTEDVDALEVHLALLLDRRNRYQLRQSGEAKLIANIIKPLGTVAFGFDLDGQETRFRASIHPTPKSLPARLFERPAQGLALPARLREKPLFFLGAHLNDNAKDELVDLMLQTEGETRSSVFADIKKNTSVDLKSAIELLHGEVSGALTLNREAFLANSASASDGLDALGMHLLLGLSDPNAAKAMLQQLASAPALLKYSVALGDQVALELPGFNAHKIRVEVVDGYLQISTVNSTPYPGAIFSDSQLELIASADTLAAMVIDPFTLSWLMFSTTAEHDEMSYRQSSMGPDAAERMRLSEIHAEQRTLTEKLDHLQREKMLSVSQAVDPLVIAARPQSGSYALLGIWHSKQHLGRAMQAFVEAISPNLEAARLTKPSPLLEIQSQLDKLSDERDRILEGSPRSR